MTRATVVSLLLLAIPAAASAQTGYSIKGGMSNFDCKNECDDGCDEFEVEIDGIRPEDVVHTYSNSNYGSPTVTLSADGSYTVIDYRHPQHLTAVGSIEHFGITLLQLSAYNSIRVSWYRNGHPATVNGQVPQPGGGSAHATQPLIPTISADLGTSAVGSGNITLTVINNDPVQSIFIKRSAQITQGTVTLEQLMPTDPTVTSTIPIDAAPILLGPASTVTYTSDLLEIEDNQTAVFAAQYFQDLGDIGPFNTDVLGPLLGHVMTASIASPDTGCDYASPVIITQPQNVTAPAGQGLELSVNAEAGDSDLPMTYQWFKEGQPLANGGQFSGVTTDGLSIESLSSATEGFYSVSVSNVCGSVLSQSALVFITGHNTPPQHALCPADFNASGVVTVQDIFDFLSAWFAKSTGADFNASGAITVQDIFDFLAAWFAGCH